MKTDQYDRMWRTLVRVYYVDSIGVDLIIPGRSASRSVLCPYQAIPPAIFKTMEPGKRYHVECNIGAKDDDDLCFDKWETK